jgi:signal transduction histidine kinase
VKLTLANCLMALLWSVVACLGVWLATTPLRRRTLTGLLASVVLTGTGAAVGAVLGGMHSMLLPMHGQATVAAIAVIAAGGGTAAAWAAARRLTRDNQAIRAAIVDLGAGRVPETGGRRLTAELEQVRTELGDTARMLAETREREQALESARRELVSWVSHDLRTPLAGLRAMSEALEDGVVDDPGPYYKQINAAVARLDGMVDDLFDLSRIQAGSFARDVEAISLVDLVSDCLAALKPLATANGVSLTGGLGPPAGPGAAGGNRVLVTGNATELNRALTNLVANAIRHTRSQGRVDIQLTTGDDAGAPGGTAEVIVLDQCGGIPIDDLPRIFDVGYRGESARTPHATNPAGAGLGLAITRGIVEAHSGTVDVENTADGCRFRIRLPRS